MPPHAAAGRPNIPVELQNPSKNHIQKSPHYETPIHPAPRGLLRRHRRLSYGFRLGRSNMERATNALWTEATNWSTAVPGSGDLVIFDANSAANLATTLNGDFSVLGVRVADPVGTVSVAAGNTLTIGASGVDMSAATQNLTLNGPISISTGQSWNIATGRTLTSNGIITAAGILTKTGAGNLILTNANTISGGITVSAGQLTTKNSTALGSNTLTLSNGATYRYERTTANVEFALL